MSRETADQGPWLVGIGASAGGLNALRALLPGLSDEAVYVIAQHMSASLPSRLADVLARESTLPVVEISDGLPIEPGTVFVAPPNKDIEIVDGCFAARTAAKRISPQPSVDLLLESLAQEAGPRSVGIVMSGTGDDGSAGVRAVQRAGGVTLAQDPVSAAYPQMPQAAIDTGAIEHVLLPQDIADVVTALVEGREANTGAGRWPTGSPMVALARETRRVTGWDMSDYKDGTLGRQVQRRIETLDLPSTDAYLDFVRENPGELSLLRDSMLIGVTGFARDADAFDALDDLLSTVVAGKGVGEPVRAWAAGAATGEEAYTLAILLAEAVRRRGGDLQVKVYASDLSERALDTARTGVYSREAVAGLPPDVLDRYFTGDGGRVQVSQRLRDLLVFARHDVARDPPFLRMDVVTCRNVLIYLIPSAQRRVLNNLYAALKPGGLLMLGSSESVPAESAEFETVDGEARIFRSRAPLTPRRPARSMPMPVPITGASTSAARASRDALRDAMRDLILEDFGPPAIVVDEGGRIVRQYGNLTGILQLPEGDSDYDYSSLIVPQLRTESVTVMTQSQRHPDGRGEHRAVVGEPPDARSITIRGRRFHPESVAQPLVLLSFEESPIPGPPGDLPSASTDVLERELTGTREHLRAVLEALESSNEQLQAMNEELQASGEELQISNEELQATNEELQATNEELSTVNDSLALRSTELSEANAVMQSIQDALNIGVILVDRHQRIARFSPLAVRVFGLLPEDIGTPIGRAPRHLPIKDLEARIDAVIQSGEGSISDISAGGDTYLFQVQPYLVDDRIRGAVLSLADISELAAARSGLQRRMEEFRALSEAVPHMVYRTSLDMQTPSYISPSVEDFYGVRADEVLADMSVILQRFHPDDVDRAVANMVLCGESGQGYELDYRIVRADGSIRQVRDINRVVADSAGVPQYRIGTVIDISDLQTALDDAERQREHFAAIFSQGGMPMATLDGAASITDANDPLAALLDVPREELVGQPLMDFVHPDDRDLESELLARAEARPGTGTDDLVRFVGPDGTTHYGQQRVVSIAPQLSAEAFQVVTITDLTELELATRLARLHQLQLAALFERSPAPMAIMGTDGVFRQVNTAFCAMLGREPDELIGHHFGEFTHADDLELDREQTSLLSEGRIENFVIDKRYVRPTGEIVWGRKLAALVPSTEDEGEYVIAQVVVDASTEHPEPTP